MTTLYRYVDRIGEYHPIVTLCIYPVIRETPCCYVINWAGNVRGFKYVGKGARKSFAYPTIELARNSYTIRKRKQLWYARQREEQTAAIVAKIEAGDWDMVWKLDGPLFFPAEA